MDTKERLLLTIVEVFQTKRPDDKYLFGVPKYDEEHTILKLLQGRSWQNADIKPLCINDDYIVFMSATAFLYFLPAFLNELLNAYASDNIAFECILNRLTVIVKNNVPRSSTVSLFCSTFNLAQRQVIKDVLEFLAEARQENDVDFFDCPFQTALDSFWKNHEELCENCKSN